MLRQVLEAVAARADDGYRKRDRRPHRRLERCPRGSGQAPRSGRANKGASGAISAPYSVRDLNRALSQDDIVVNEAIRNAPLVQEHIRRTRPGSYVGLAGGGLGFSAAAWRWA